MGNNGLCKPIFRSEHVGYTSTPEEHMSGFAIIIPVICIK